MNIFRVLASGRQPMREEYISALLGYLLAPEMDHGLGAKLLATLVQNIGEQLQNHDLLALSQQLDNRLRNDLFEINRTTSTLDLEVAYRAPNGNHGFIDLVLKTGPWFIAIENKILTTSITREQLLNQYNGLKQVLGAKAIQDHHVLMIYLVPASQNSAGWSIQQDLFDELEFPHTEGDAAVLVSWQPTPDHPLSFVGVIREVLRQESEGSIAPISYDVRHMLLAFIDFILGEFQGYPYARVVGGETVPTMKVSDLLLMNEDIYVGIQHGMSGLIRRAWKQSDFKEEFVNISQTSRGWQYLSLVDFKILTQWAIDPDNHTLAGIHWNGSPFFTDRLYLVAKSAGESMYIGIRGGLEELKRMQPDDIRSRDTWQISSQKKSVQWFSGREFVAVLESKSLIYDAPVSKT